MTRADELSFELARAALEQIDPDEVALLDALGLDFVEASSAPRQSDGALGFDVAQITMAVAASSVAVAVKDYMVGVLTTYASDEGAVKIRSLVSFFKRKRGAGDKSSSPRGDETAVALAEPELAEVRRRAFSHARGLGLSEAKANLLADAISGSFHVTS